MTDLPQAIRAMQSGRSRRAGGELPGPASGIYELGYDDAREAAAKLAEAHAVEPRVAYDVESRDADQPRGAWHRWGRAFETPALARDAAVPLVEGEDYRVVRVTTYERLEVLS